METPEGKHSDTGNYSSFGDVECIFGDVEFTFDDAECTFDDAEYKLGQRLTNFLSACQVTFRRERANFSKGYKRQLRTGKERPVPRKPSHCSTVGESRRHGKENIKTPEGKHSDTGNYSSFKDFVYTFKASECTFKGFVCIFKGFEYRLGQRLTNFSSTCQVTFRREQANFSKGSKRQLRTGKEAAAYLRRSGTAGGRR